eukprot:TRINITY_DN4060_c0_g1_i2.p1 TRINITY_DN4060_c0_g1~~TRINITY_DN4060_c0_g1_i2.p1  ORF type:complete len:109 (-),score=28.62 TRINITY_DN4060_c0_g1_i2:46-372(-)
MMTTHRRWLSMTSRSHSSSSSSSIIIISSSSSISRGDRFHGEQCASSTAHPQTTLAVSIQSCRLHQQWTARGQETGEGQTTVLDLDHVDGIVQLVSYEEDLSHRGSME